MKAFQDTKKALAEATRLTRPGQNVPTSLTTNASDLAIGVVLQQFVDGTWVPLAFFSQKLWVPGKKYSAFDHELLALYLSIRHFRYFLEGQQFIAFTNHKPLTFCMSKASESMSGRQQRQLLYISEFTTDIQHIQGKAVSDTLSRATIAKVHLGFDYNSMATAQQQDAEVQAYHTATSSLQFEDVPFGTQGVTLLHVCDTSTGRLRPLVLASWRHQVFDLIHGLSHPSVRATRKLIAARFV